MTGIGGRFWRFLPGSAFLLCLVLASTSTANVSDPADAAPLLVQADALKASSNVEFNRLMARLGGGALRLTPQQQVYRSYLLARHAALRGDSDLAWGMLVAIGKQTINPVMAFRANATMVDMAVEQARYQEAFERLAPLVEKLPHVTDLTARAQGLGVAAQLYNQAGQYALAQEYADRLLAESHGGENACRGWYYKLDALLRAGSPGPSLVQLGAGLDACSKAGEGLFANGVTREMAQYDLQRRRPREAIQRLRLDYPRVVAMGYKPAIAMNDALLARAYWDAGDLAQTEAFAQRVIRNAGGTTNFESLVSAYCLQSLVKEKKNDIAGALANLKKYVEAERHQWDDARAKALAFQIVQQQVMARKNEIAVLAKQNEILTLQQSLGKKAMETSRLYILLLLLSLGMIVLWMVRIKRSQMIFRTQARRDGLTGIFNRQHFLDEAERALRYCARSAREAGLVLIDLDHFKRLNDTHGHAVGDRVLQMTVVACERQLRSTDVFGRLGGEEFGIVMPECTLEQVVERAEQLRLAISGEARDADLDIAVTASFGVAVSARSGADLRQLLIHADDALYEAKSSGRNCVVVFDPDHGAHMDRLRKSRVTIPAVVQEA